MTGEIHLDLSGPTLRLAGLSEAVLGRLEQEWKRFVVGPVADPFLSVRVSVARRPFDPGVFEPKRMRSRFEPARAHFSMNGGEIDVDDRGRARVELAEGLAANEYHTLMNLLRAGLAWRLPQRGAALLHAAGLIVDDRAFLLVGAEGSGKSTWARLGVEAGARALSDDLVLVERGGSGMEALGAPFRSTHLADYRPGRWPLAAILFPRHGEPVEWVACGALAAQARIAANLPFVSSALEQDARVAAVVERLARTVPCRELTFRPDASFLELLRA